MTAALRFDPIRLPPKCEELRKEVRAFLAEEMARGTFHPFKPNREDTDVPEFCRRVGERVEIGMTWPKKYGGQERSFLERERLGEGDTDPHQNLQATGQLGLTGDTLDRLADDDAHADGRADGGEAVTDGGDVAVDCSDVHVVCFLP